MRASGAGDPPPSVAGGLTGGLTGGMTGGLEALELGRVRAVAGGRGRAAELASEAARAEGASTTATRSGRRADRSAIGATSRRRVAGGLAVAADQAEEGGPLLRVEGDQQPHRRGPAAAGQPRRRPPTVPAGGRAAGRARGELGQGPGLAAGWAALGGVCWTGGQEPLGSWGITRVLSSWLLRGSLGCWPRWWSHTTGAASARATFGCRRAVGCCDRPWFAPWFAVRAGRLAAAVLSTPSEPPSLLHR
jgi:hypothetical protein